MARRRGRRETYEVRRSEAYDVPLPSSEAVRAPRVSRFDQADVLATFVPEYALVYPWAQSTPLRVYSPSPYRHERSEFSRRVLASSLSQLTVRSPARQDFCRQRKQRKQVLFAKRVAGSGMRMRRRKYRFSSKWRC